MWNFIIVGTIFFIIDLILLFGIIYLGKKIRKIVDSKRKYSETFYKNLISGIAAGIIVIILDRSINIILSQKLNIDWKLYLPLIKSLVNFIIVISFESFLMILLVLFTIYVSLWKATKFKK